MLALNCGRGAAQAHRQHACLLRGARRRFVTSLDPALAAGVNGCECAAAVEAAVCSGQVGAACSCSISVCVRGFFKPKVMVAW